MPIYALNDVEPEIDPEAYVHPDAVVIGNVKIGPNSTIWPGAVLRGDSGRIEIGQDTSIQDGTVVHATHTLATIIGSRCVVGHIAHLEGCTVADDVLVGSGSILLHRVQVQPNSLVGAGALLPPGTLVPSGAMALGVPAKIIPDKVAPGSLASTVANYVNKGKLYRQSLRRLD